MTTVEGTNVTIPTPDGVADAYVARPDDDTTHPGIVFYTDIFGIRPSTKRMADRLASGGYTVLMPHVAYRRGPSPIVHMPEYVETPEELWELATKVFGGVHVTPEEYVRDAGVWLDWLEADSRTSDGPFGTNGYCHGGMLALRTAIAYPDRIAAAAIIHGSSLISDAPDSPHRSVDRIKAELYLNNGGADSFATPEQSKAFDEVLTAAGVTFRSEMHPGCEHGYTAADTFVYNKAADDAHWAGMFDLFGRVLGERAPASR